MPNLNIKRQKKIPVLTLCLAAALSLTACPNFALAGSLVTVAMGEPFGSGASAVHGFTEFTLSKFSKRGIWASYVFRFYQDRPSAVPAVTLSERTGKLPKKIDCILSITDNKSGSTPSEQLVGFVASHAERIGRECESRMHSNFLTNLALSVSADVGKFSTRVTPGSGFSFMSMGPNAIPGFSVTVQPRGARPWVAASEL